MGPATYYCRVRGGLTGVTFTAQGRLEAREAFARHLGVCSTSSYLIVATHAAKEVVYERIPQP